MLEVHTQSPDTPFPPLPSSPAITHSLSTSSEASLLVFERRYAGQVNLGC